MYKQLQQRGMESPPVNVGTLREMKQAREPIACLTAYDASFAQLVDLAGTDVVLVGDSLGMVVQGLDTTVPVTVDDMVYHTAAVARGLRRAWLVADMPFMSARDVATAMTTATRLMAEAFPNSRFSGFDTHQASVDAARRSAEAAGVSKRVEFS
jgi:3-methyl-2-oxobutanoate hydroxymethyltransferase